MRSILLLFAAVAVAVPALAEEAQIHPKLEPLVPYVGKTWKGEFANSTPENPVFDVQRWELILNGQAVRITHSLNEGMYCGETIVQWDQERETLAYWYFTSGGFRTEGTFSFDGETFMASEAVTGSAEGITEVRSSGRLLPDGRLESKSEYLKNGEWVPGHSAIYVEAPDAELVFRNPKLPESSR